MPVIVSVVGAGLAALAVVVLAGWIGRPDHAAIDPEPTERWLVAALSRRPRTRRIVRTLDRRAWGGAMVALGLLVVVAAAAVVGWILVTIDDDRGFARFDESVAEWGSEHATPASTEVLQGITLLGDTLLLLAVMAAVGLVVVWRRPGTQWSVLGFLVTVGLGVSAINNALKWMIMRDRPGVDHLVGSGGSAFPSGHAAAAAACWAALALVVSARMRVGSRRWAAALAIALAVLVAASRVTLGVHWLTDVVAGLVVGWAWFFLVALVFGGRITRIGEPLERVHADDATAPIEHEGAST